MNGRPLFETKADGLKLRFFLKHQVNLIISINEFGVSVLFMVYETGSNNYRSYTNSDLPAFIDRLTILATDAVESCHQHEANFLNSQAYRDLRDYVRFMFK
jgi:hypothetical protein